MTNATLRRSILPLSAALLLGALISGLALRPQQATAQNASLLAPQPTSKLQMRRFRANSDRVLSEKGFERVIPFENMPVFIAIDEKQIAVVEVAEDEVRILRSIDKPREFKEVILLGDGRTFLVRSSKTLVAHTVDQVYVQPTIR